MPDETVVTGVACPKCGQPGTFFDTSYVPLLKPCEVWTCKRCGTSWTRRVPGGSEPDERMYTQAELDAAVDAVAVPFIDCPKGHRIYATRGEEEKGTWCVSGVCCACADAELEANILRATQAEYENQRRPLLVVTRELRRLARELTGIVTTLEQEWRRAPADMPTMDERRAQATESPL